MPDSFPASQEKHCAPSTLVEALRLRAEMSPKTTAYIFATKDGCEAEISWGELEQRVRSIAAELQRKGLPVSGYCWLTPRA